MPVWADEKIQSFCGSRARLLTLAVLAAAEVPMTGYRVAAVAGLPREKVYPELRAAIESSSAVKSERGYAMVDEDLRRLLRARTRVTWDSYWDRPGRPSADAVDRELDEIRKSRRRVRLYNPNNRIPPEALRELVRDPEKDRALRRTGLRPSRRKNR
jgi:hypothetical protein